MPQDFYTLDQAAERLGLPVDKLKEMANRREVRAFVDRGTQRFRKQEIDELARQRGMGSDVDLQLGDSGMDESRTAGASAAPSGGEAFPFDLGNGGSDAAGHGSPKSGPKPNVGSDNEVKLVGAGSEVELKVQQPTGKGEPGSSINLGGPRTGRVQKDEGGFVTDDDSDVKLVDEGGSMVMLGSDREKRELRPGSDSDVRLEDVGSGSGLMPDSGVRLVDDRPPSSKAKRVDTASPTEEINLDEELRRMEEALTPDPRKALQETSAFEFPPVDKGPGSGKTRKPDSSSDFDFTAALKPKDESVDIDFGVDLGQDVTRGAAASGINLHRPADSGKSLNDSSEDSITFELEADEGTGGKTPQPKARQGGKAPEVDSSSEFELTLDDDSLQPMGGESSSQSLATDLVLKGDDSGSDELRLGPGSSSDLNLDTSDFELALDEEPSGEGETGSEVIVIDEGAEEADATAVRPEALDALEAEEVGELLDGEEEVVVEEAVDDEVVPSTGPAAAAEAVPAEWGWWSIMHLPTSVVLLFVGFLLFEMLQSIWGYNQPTAVGSKIFDMFANMMK